MSAGASGFPSGESMNRGQIGPGADARRPRVGPSTVRATSHRHRIGKRMPCGTVRAMQPDSTRAGDTDRRPPSGESHVAGCPPRGCRDVCPPCVPRDCPPRLCPHNRPRAARPAAHAVTWPGLDRGWGRHIGGKNAVHCLLFCLPFSDGVKTATTRTPPSRNPCPFSTVSLLSPF